MTVSSTNRLAQFAGNGAASTFAFAFMVFAASDLVAIKSNNTTGAETPLVLNTDYTVALNANQSSYPGGTVTLSAGALADGYTLTITSAVPETQSTDLTNSGGFYPEVITAALDRLTVLVQQLQQAVNQSLAIPVGDPLGLTTELGPSVQRAGMFLTFDGSGNAQTTTSVASVIAEVASALAAALASATSSAASATSAASAATSAAAAAASAAAAAAAAVAGETSVGYGETIATGGQTVFATPSYTPGANNLFVTEGGQLLTNGIDYTETNTVTITLTQAAAAGEVYTFRSL